MENKSDKSDKKDYVVHLNKARKKRNKNDYERYIILAAIAVVIICSITVFGSLFGFIGMFLGVPLICVIRMFFNDFLQYRKNKIIDK